VSILGALAAEIAEAAAVVVAVVAAADVQEVLDMQSTGGIVCSSGGQ